MVSDTAAPQALACLMMAAAGRPPASFDSSWTRRHAASASKRFRYDRAVPESWTFSSHQVRSPTMR